MKPVIELIKPILESYKPMIVVFKHKSEVKHRFVIQKPMFVEFLCIELAIAGLHPSLGQLATEKLKIILRA